MDTRSLPPERQPVLAAALRTPFGKLGGELAGLGAVDLGTEAVRALLERAGWDPAQVDQVIFGNVVSAGLGQIPARQVAIKAGIPSTVPALSVNKVCASALKSVTLAALMVAAGEAEAVVAGGTESMSGAPHLLRGVRRGLKFGDATLEDANLRDGLIDPFDGVLMGSLGHGCAVRAELDRESLDRWSLRSHQRYFAALDAGRFADEVVPVRVPGSARGEDVRVKQDEGPRRDTSIEALGKLRPAFEGTMITAGNAPGLSDGATAALVTSRARAEAMGIRPLARIITWAEAALDPPYMGEAPAVAAQLALEGVGMKPDQMKRSEVNEAFASVALSFIQNLGLDPETVNVNGGAVAIGHPVGATGARILMTLAYELRRLGGGLGLAAICSGTAQGDACIIEA